MTYSMQPIIQHLFQADSLEDVSMERLEAFVEEYPSFGVGHYLLSHKLRVEDAGRFNGETQRTNLYFTNPFWLQWMLDNAGGDAAAMVAVRHEMPVIGEPVENETLIPEPEPVLTEETMFISEPMTEPEPAPELEIIPEPVSTPEPVAEPEEAVAANEEPIRDEEPPFVLEEMENKERALPEPAEATTDLSAAELLLQSIQEAHGLRQSLQKINEDLTTGYKGESVTEGLSGEEGSSGLEEKHSGEKGERGAEEEHGAEEEEPSAEEEYPAPEEEDNVSENDQNNQAFSSGAIGAALERAAREMETDRKTGDNGDMKGETIPMEGAGVADGNMPAEQSGVVMGQSVPPGEQPVTEQPIAFEPYHTIDYFASQGIKLTLDENPSDSLGRQLKSFTDWLKVMRRLPQKDREIVPDIAAERTVQSIAAHSIEGREVVTEAMAEVLAKQGMPEKAQEVYHKLSLLNPGKRAYFAAKIEQLNIH
jgi:hypothetical protein